MEKLTGIEKFKNTVDRDFSIQEYWSYAFSDMHSNIVRGLIAEFIVLNALKDDTVREIRSPGNGFDILYNERKVEVKCSSYIRKWGEKRDSVVSWVGLKADDLYLRPKTKLAPDGTIAYQADVYVLALLVHRDYATLDIMNLQQWCFYVLPREQLTQIAGNKNYLPITKVERQGLLPVSFASLRATVDTCLKNTP